MADDGNTAPVIAGIVVGLGIILLFSTFFNNTQFSPDQYSAFRPGQFREAAIKIALQNSTLQQEFQGKEPVVTNYRDWGVGHLFYDCPMNKCAHVGFADISNPETTLFAVLVNMQIERVVEIRATNDVLVAKTKDIDEVRMLLSKYPNAEVIFNPGPGYSEVIYRVSGSEPLSLWIKATPNGEITTPCNLRN